MSLFVFIALFFPVVLSGISVFFFKTGEKTLKLILAFGGAFLLTLTFTELIPEIYSSESQQIGLFIMLGFFIQLLLDFLTKGVEHGHHSHHEKLNEPCRKKNEHVSFLAIMIGICIHSFLEGMPLTSNFQNTEIKNTLLSGIIIHNIPMSIVLVSLLLHTGLKKSTAVILLMIFALSAPMGTLTSFYLGESFAENMSHFFNIILAIVVGIFLHISTTILFESEEQHGFNLYKFIAIIIGAGISLLSLC
ncbi:MAG TPA: ZIP family metal transporter [Bacteroidales bacterium]|nr:ZIP family metal transporter [Bacteroidales bacterium]HPS16436.1 ZIP family metal transporter [Bacteroidales bacterium]